MKTDAQIKKDIEEELEWDPFVTSTDVGVIVNDGVVTLTGLISSYAEKIEIKHAAQRVSGVKTVVVEMDVKIVFADIRRDSDIAAAAVHALHWNVKVPSAMVQVRVEDGWISLNGEVDWEYQRRAVLRSVQYMVGVVGVSNLITLRPRISPIDIQRDIKGALIRQAEREARHMHVVVDGSRVTLKGKVHSWAVWEAAHGAAWSSPGVSGVKNELVIAEGLDESNAPLKTVAAQSS